MSIYPERNKRGQPTGTWVVEVRKDGKIIRRRTKDLVEARQIEANLRAGVNIPKQVPASAEVFTLTMLYGGARSVYRGTKDEKQSLQRLETSLAILGLDMDVRVIRTPQLDRLVDVLRARGLDNKTINRYLYAVSAALKWAVERDHITHAPKVPRQPESIGRIAFLSEANEAPFMGWLVRNGYQDVAFVSQVLIATGFRITELLGLKPEAVTRDGWVHLYQGETKNGQGRAAYIGDEMAKDLQARLVHSLPPYNRIREGMRGASEALGIDPVITPHVLRHTTATRLNSKGVSTATIAKLLGHKTLVTTLKYAHVEQEALKDAAGHLGVPLSRREIRDEATGVPIDNVMKLFEKRPAPNGLNGICSPLRNHSATRPKPK